MNEAGNRIQGTTRKMPLKRFAEVERTLLISLPGVPPDLAIWAKGKVHRDAHVQFEQSFYSVLYRLVGQELWLKATDTMVTLYRGQESVAAHVRLSRPGSRRTVDDHPPSADQAWQLLSRSGLPATP
jgi:hypothetical protein